MTPAGRIRDDRAAGFTVLELLLVMAILAMAAVIAVPAVSTGRASAVLMANTAALSAHLRAARTTAIASNVEQAVWIDVARRRFWTEGDAARAVSSGISVTGSARAQDLAPRAVRIRFFPDGTSSGGVVTLADGVRAAQIVVDWRSGTSRIAWSRVR